MRSEYDDLNKARLELLEALPVVLHNAMKHKFKDVDMAGSDTKSFYEDIKNTLSS